jgi:two-component system cell cycle sensor histidine kinase/response regulator CckA
MSSAASTVLCGYDIYSNFGGAIMIENFQKQSHIKILPAFGVDGRLSLRETDLNEVVKTLEGVLPQYVNGDIDVTITLLEKNLKIMADMALMRETLTHLIETAMDAVPGQARFSLTVNQVNYEIESLLNGDNSIIGACAFICLTDTDRGIDEKIKEKIFEPFFTTKIDGNGLGLAIAYRIIKQHHGRIKAESQAGQGTEVNVYLPLTKPEIVSMMSIPIGASYGRIH